MTRSRSHIVAIQAIVVGVLLVVVFLTLLRPESDTPLFGINAPGEKEEAANNANGGGSNGGSGSGSSNNGNGNNRGNGGNGGQGGSVDGEHVASAGVAPAPPAATAPLPTPIAPGPANGGGGESDSPTDDQYADTVTRLIDGLQRGS